MTRRVRALALALVVVAASTVVPTPAGAAEEPPVVGGAPTLNLRDGQALDGTVTELRVAPEDKVQEGDVGAVLEP